MPLNASYLLNAQATKKGSKKDTKMRNSKNVNTLHVVVHYH